MISEVTKNKIEVGMNDEYQTFTEYLKENYDQILEESGVTENKENYNISYVDFDVTSLKVTYKGDGIELSCP